MRRSTLVSISWISRGQPDGRWGAVRPLDHDAGPVAADLRLPGVARLGAALVAVGAVVAAAGAVVEPIGEAVVGGLLLVGVLALLALVLRRVRVVLGAAALEVHDGWSLQVVPWSSVEGIWQPRGRLDGAVFVLVRPDDLVQLPPVRQPDPSGLRRGTPAADVLRTHAALGGAPLLADDHAAVVGEQRLLAHPSRSWPAGRRSTRWHQVQRWRVLAALVVIAAVLLGQGVVDLFA